MASDFVDEIAAGKLLDLDGETIVGDVDLRPVDTATKVIRCTDCTFTGSIRASNVIFNRVVDLSGSIVTGMLDMNGAVFKDAFLVRPTPRGPATIGGAALFALATFGGRASFEGVEVTGNGDFTVAQFRADASFGDARFGGTARFDSAVFAGAAQFSGTPFASAASSSGEAPPGCSPSIQGAFVGPVSFADATFHDKADFHQRCFGDDASFAGATFGTADFTLARFTKRATFDDAAIDGLASFRVVTFSGDLSFQHVVLGGPTDFEGAIFAGKARLFGTSAAESLSLVGLTAYGPLNLDKLHADDLQLDLSIVPAIPGEPVQERVLSMIEASARAHGDLALSNEAAFERSSLQTDHATGAAYLFGLIGKWIAGYLVKPTHPLLAFLVLVAIGTGVRAAARWARARRSRDLGLAAVVSEMASAPARSIAAPAAAQANAAQPEIVRADASPPNTERTDETPPPGRLLAASQGALALVNSMTDTISAAFTARVEGVKNRSRLASYGEALVKGLEWVGFKVLIALVLIGLANSNPTFKQLVEAVLR